MVASRTWIALRLVLEHMDSRFIPRGAQTYIFHTSVHF